MTEENVNFNVKSREEQVSNISDINSLSSKSDDESIYLIDYRMENKLNYQKRIK